MTLSAVDKTAAAFRSISGRLLQVERQAKAFNRTNTVMAKGVTAAYLGAARYAGPALAGFVSGKAFSRFAEVERRMNRIGITADASSRKTADALGVVQRVAAETAQPIDQVADGLDALVAAGKSLDEATAFLPSVAATAQAAGAEMRDIATSADAVSRSLGIEAHEMQRAFDIMAAAGKKGKFELKDMAQYVPSLAPAFARVGYEGETGLKKLVSVLQTIRNYTGSSSEAATALENILNKMGSEETVKKFAKMGVKNLREELEKTRKAGGDVIDRLVELTLVATKGDLSKLPLLFTDQEFLKGMNAVIQGSAATRDMVTSLNSVDGTVMKDLGRILEDNQAKIDKMKGSWDSFMTSFGGAVSGPVGGMLDAATEQLEWQAALDRGKKKRGLTLADTAFMTKTEQNRIAFDGGWRTPEGRLAETGKRAISPERGGGSGWTGAGPQIPVPTARPTPQSRMVDQYNQYGLASQAMRNAGTRMENAIDPGSSAMPAFDPDEFEQKLKNGGFEAAQTVKGGVEQGGDAAAASMSSALREAGAELSASIRSAVQGINVNVNVEGGQPGRTKGGQSDGRPMPRANVGASQAGRAGGPR